MLSLCLYVIKEKIITHHSSSRIVHSVYWGQDKKQTRYLVLEKKPTWKTSSSCKQNIALHNGTSCGPIPCWCVLLGATLLLNTACSCCVLFSVPLYVLLCACLLLFRVVKREEAYHTMALSRTLLVSYYTILSIPEDRENRVTNYVGCLIVYTTLSTEEKIESRIMGIRKNAIIMENRGYHCATWTTTRGETPEISQTWDRNSTGPAQYVERKEEGR